MVLALLSRCSCPSDRAACGSIGVYRVLHLYCAGTASQARRPVFIIPAAKAIIETKQNKRKHGDQDLMWARRVRLLLCAYPAKRLGRAHSAALVGPKPLWQERT